MWTLEIFLFTKHCEKEVNISVSYNNQVIWQNSRQKHNIVKRKSSPKVILQFLLTSQKNNKKAEKGDADAITIDSREGQIFWLLMSLFNLYSISP